MSVATATIIVISRLNQIITYIITSITIAFVTIASVIIASIVSISADSIFAATVVIIRTIATTS